MIHSLEPRIRERIASDFPPHTRSHAEKILAEYAGRERARVQWDILELSKGDIAKVKHFTDTANLDYRDILYWAEYYDNDPLIKGIAPGEGVRKAIRKLKPR